MSTELTSPSNQFDEIIAIIEKAKARAIKAVNAELIQMYWNVGEYLSGLCANSSFGDKIIDEVATYIAQSSPNLKGFNRRGLYRMRQFYETYKDDKFVTPLVTQISWTNHLLKKQPTTLRASSFWNANICNPASMDLAKLNSNMRLQLTTFGNSIIPNGDTEKFGRPYVSRSPGTVTNPVIAFGAQYKFWCVDMYGTNSFPFMRAEEMLLIEAEAACYNGDEATARKCLSDLVALRNPGQDVSSLSGDALLEQVKLQRRMELWGEGFNWFDLKRWNMPMVRNPWEAGNVNSNNIPAIYQLRKEANDPGWRFIIPQSETQYNNAINMSLVQ